MKPRWGPEQLSEMYEIQPSFTKECGPGWISILDNIDDKMMMHKMQFIGLKAKDDLKTLVRAACVIQRGENVQEFYSDTSTLRVLDYAIDNDEDECECKPSTVYRGYILEQFND
jgi:hypothetical protein